MNNGNEFPFISRIRGYSNDQCNLRCHMARSVVDMGGLEELENVLSNHSFFYSRRFPLFTIVIGFLSDVEIRPARCGSENGGD